MGRQDFSDDVVAFVQGSFQGLWITDQGVDLGVRCSLNDCGTDRDSFGSPGRTENSERFVGLVIQPQFDGSTHT